MTATKDVVVKAVEEKCDAYLGIKLKSLAKLTKEDLDIFNDRLDRMAEKPAELFASLAHTKLRARIDDTKDRIKTRVMEKATELLDSL